MMRQKIHNKNKIKERGSDLVFNVINTILLTIVFLIVAYPLIYVISASFSSSTAIIQGKVKLLPVDFSLEGYKAVFAYKAVISGYLNSLFYMVVGTTLNIVCTVMIAYPLSRKDLKGKEIIIGMLIFTMMFNAGMIPNYLLNKYLHLIDTRWVMIIPKALNVWNVMITIAFFKSTLPEELLEASRIDGCDDFTYIRKVAIPLSKAILAVITLYYAVDHWNSYFDAMIYVHNPSMRPLQLVLRDILVNNKVSLDMLGSIDPQQLAVKENLATLLKYSLIIISSAPLMIMYPFVQKHFVKGVMVGSIKG